MRHFCHECQYEGDSFPSNADGIVCPECRGDFVEEIPEDGTAADDPRDFDPDDADGPDPAALPFFLAAPPGGGPGVLRFQLPGGGGAFIAQAGGGAGGAAGAAAAAQALGGLNPLTLAMLRSFGLPEPAPAAGANGQGDGAGRAAQQDGQGDQQAGEHDAPPHRPHQVPIRNLATFLGEAFGAATPHPADAPDNNPFAEGGHERNHPDADGNADAPGAAPPRPGVGGGLGFLGALLNAFGGGAPNGAGGFALPANMGDYALGEGGFQQILNDLMEQAAGRAGPQPAPDDMIAKLPRVKVTQELLDLDSITTCAVCQDEWALDETAIPLPCKPSSHLYHEDCIVPWLKTSGTCPTCRFALVPQPGQPGYGEDQAQPHSQPQPQQGDAVPGPNASSAPTRPPLPGRQSSLNPHSPATARIPEVAGGSSLPGSWMWSNDGEGEGEGDAADPDDMEVEGRGEEGREEGRERERDPAAAAREAAERRAQEERRAREGSSAAGPIIEDVD
ncbi:hypothetical protein JCM3775_000498 [Rhodotorula graminis]|uniref:RING-type domain-containing protein n=1 Tax=Rhodotorula graminis (strain WP1) TaxID=578459 RepID=A0A194SDP0_RHOGW|nr:uncharacterized protein RHOBADRAFT_51371 [Rhodotorula graminis WP1]KPV77526.1 hypothetical protein RHOBADRAFT_51371 [Rhodotorula graminis WP1]